MAKRVFQVLDEEEVEIPKRTPFYAICNLLHESIRKLIV